jgi:hypothetical protein
MHWSFRMKLCYDDWSLALSYASLFHCLVHNTCFEFCTYIAHIQSHVHCIIRFFSC